MRLVSLIARRSLSSRPARTLFSALGIALGIATVVAVVTLDYNTIVGFSRPYQLASGPDIEVRPLQPDADGHLDPADLEGVSAVSAFFQQDALIAVADGEPERVRLFALESAALPDLGVHRLARGRDLVRDRATREVLIGEPLAQQLGVDLGDEVRIARPRRTARKACVDGVIQQVGEAPADDPPELAFSVVGVLAREKLGYRSRGQVLIVDYDWARDLYRGVHVEPRYWGRRDPNVDIEHLRTSLSESYSYELAKSVVLGQAADERAFRMGVRMTGLLALVLGLYVIFHTLSMSLTERVGEVAMLHALGATRAAIARVFLLEAVLLAGAGALLGLAGGLLLARGLLAAGITTLGTGKEIEVFLVPWSSILPLVAAGFAVALAGSVYPLMRLRGANTVAALRGEEALRGSGVARGFQLFFALLVAIVLPSLYLVLVPVLGQFSAALAGVMLGAVGFLALLVVLPLVMPRILAGVCALLTRPFIALWPLAGRLAARTMGQSPTRIAVSASAVALVTAGFVALEGMTASLRGEVEVWGDEALTGKVYAEHLGDVPLEELARHLRAFPGVLAVESASARAYDRFLLLGLDPDEIERHGPLAGRPALRSKLRDQHGMILSRRLAKAFGYEVGDGVWVKKADGTSQEFRVLEISDRYGFFPHPDERMYAVVADEYLRRYFCVDVETASDLAVVTEEGTDPGAVEAGVRDFLSSRDGGASGAQKRVRFQTGEAILGAHVADIDRDFVLFDVLIALTAALAALGVTNGLLLAALERSKEIGVLEALGTTARQIAGTVLLESVVVGLVGGAVGVAVGAAATPLAVSAIQELAGLALPHAGAGPWIPQALAGAVSLSVAAGFYPIWRMSRFDAVAAVRTG